MGYTIEDEPTLTLEERTLHEDLKKLLEKQNKDILSSIGATQTEAELAKTEQDYINSSEDYRLDDPIEEPKGKKLPCKALDYVQASVVTLEKEIEAEYQELCKNCPKAHPAIQWAIDIIDWIKENYTDLETTEEKHNRNIKDRKDLRLSTVDEKRKGLIRKVTATYEGFQAVYSAELRDKFAAETLEYIRKRFPQVKSLEMVKHLTLVRHERGEKGEFVVHYEGSIPKDFRAILLDMRVAKKHNFVKSPKGTAHIQYKKDKLEIYVKKASGEN